MTLRTEIKAPGAPPELAAIFRDAARVFYEGYDRERVRLGIPESDVTAILADDFVVEVNAHARHGEVYDPARLGGAEAIAKNISLTDDHTEVVVVFDGTLWHGEGDAEAQAFRLGIVSHELAHPLLNRARAASGASDSVPKNPMPDDVLADAARGLADEYRADRLAEVALGALTTVAVDGETRPYRSWWSRGYWYVNGLATILAEAHPGWAGTVDRFRQGETSAVAMWMALAGAINDTLVQLVHAQAFADAAKVGVNVLEIPEVAALPATQLYLAGPVPAFLDLMRRVSALAPLAETLEVEGEIVTVGGDMLRGIFQRLGVRAVGDADGAVNIQADLLGR